MKAACLKAFSSARKFTKIWAVGYEGPLYGILHSPDSVYTLTGMQSEVALESYENKKYYSPHMQGHYK